MHGKPFVRRFPGEGAGHALRTCGDEKGLEVSLRCLFEDQLVQGEIRDCASETKVLLLELFQALSLFNGEAAILPAPPVVEPALSGVEWV